MLGQIIYTCMYFSLAVYDKGYVYIDQGLVNLCDNYKHILTAPWPPKVPGTLSEDHKVSSSCDKLLPASEMHDSGCEWLAVNEEFVNNTFQLCKKGYSFSTGIHSTQHICVGCDYKCDQIMYCSKTYLQRSLLWETTCTCWW